LFSHEKIHRVLELKKYMALHTVEVPSITNILEDIRGLDQYLFEKSYGEIEDEVAFMIHSSGTTGMGLTAKSLYNFYFQPLTTCF
jgi:hypothetical protein